MKYANYGTTILLFIATNLYTEYGCMDTSYHCAQPNDPKQYHMVTGADGGPCSCPCSKYCAKYRCSSLARGKCPVCGHYRVPRSFVIVKKPEHAQEFKPTPSSLHIKLPIRHKRGATNQASRIP